MTYNLYIMNTSKYLYLYLYFEEYFRLERKFGKRPFLYEK